MTRSSTEPPRQRFYRRHPRWTLFAFLLVLIPTMDLGATAVLRWSGLYSPPSSRAAEFRRPDPIYHHDLRPMVSAHSAGIWGHREYDVFTNSLGFKDGRPREIPLRTEAKRVLFLGDSFTEGVGVAYPETFVGILDRELGARGIEVLNAGVVSYSPAIYLKKCEHLIETVGLHFDHLVLCLDLSDIPDEIDYHRGGLDGNLKPTSRIDDTFKTFIRRNTILLNGIRDGWRWVRKEWLETRTVLAHVRSSWTSDEALFESLGKPGLKLAAEHLDQLHELLGRHGIAMTLVVYPWPDQIMGRERDCRHVVYWRKWAGTKDIPFVDLFPTFLDAGPADEVVRTHYIDRDMHWNEAGHRLVARRLKAALWP